MLLCRVSQHKIWQVEGDGDSSAMELENIDFSFDSSFDAMSALTWRPWVGKSFQSTSCRTLILGESVYDIPGLKGWSERLKSKDGLRITHCNHAMNPMKRSKFVRNIERALFQKKRPATTDVKALWESVVYHNLVLRSMNSLKHRPSYSDYVAGWEEAMKLIELLEIDQILVYGLEGQKIKALKHVAGRRGLESGWKKFPPIGRSFPKVATLTLGQRKISILFIRHPSSFFPWRKWGRFLDGENFLSSFLRVSEPNHILQRTL